MMTEVNYTVETRGDQTGVLEHPTGLFIPLEKNVVKRICESLNWGSGFNGYTPQFFTIKTEHTFE